MHPPFPPPSLLNSGHLPPSSPRAYNLLLLLLLLHSTNLDRLGLDEVCAHHQPSSQIPQERDQLTLNLRNGRKKDLTLELLVGQLLLHGREDRLDELALLRLADLSLVADPRVEDRLDFGRDGRLLAEGEGLVLEGGGLLRAGCGGLVRVGGCGVGGRGRGGGWRSRTCPGEQRGGAGDGEGDGEAGRGGERRTLESSKRDLVSASTSLSSPTDSILVLTASVWLALETFRISVTFYTHHQTTSISSEFSRPALPGCPGPEKTTNVPGSVHLPRRGRAHERASRRSRGRRQRNRG